MILDTAHNNTMSQIGEYTILPITIPSTPAYPKPTTHTIFLRQHVPKIPTENDSRSLFLVNVPIDSTYAHLRAAFNSLIGPGRFESVFFEHEKKPIPSATTALAIAGTGPNKKRKRGDDTPSSEGLDLPLPQIWDRELRKSGSTAVVVLVDERSVEGALKAAKKLGKKSKEREIYIWGEGVTISSSGSERSRDRAGSGQKDGVPPLGSARYLAHQKLRFPSKLELQKNVDAFMTAFNALEESRALEAKRTRNVPDEDGFVTVVRGGRSGPARMEDAERKREELERKEEEKRDVLRKGDFYRFQGRERRKVEMGELVRRFEGDRRRVEELKGRKGRGGFRPES
ncbi:Ribosomal RNA-processing protein 7 [Cadophora gregata]|uniref:Ribosomal RNA-processing protein 7 n=1 Tax=Cadophora gregata TaxID=51156 RepID=UPI0026DB27AD|nr:Ribosomal RNA-processing protein 7 [Cadophora gregata]KAK0102369.1 Ribosomal RNA-processing protein 7 [Cadophora gregata]